MRLQDEQLVLVKRAKSRHIKKMAKKRLILGLNDIRI